MSRRAITAGKSGATHLWDGGRFAGEFPASSEDKHRTGKTATYLRVNTNQRRKGDGNGKAGSKWKPNK